ncbi:MAG: exodeoxyribonuclease V subunit gamma, partial [Methylococcales bacterium]
MSIPDSDSTAPVLATGMAIIHSNHLENLRELVVTWLQLNPLKPLENEIVLVQSNGMAQWLKLALASEPGLGICAAIDMQLPASFLWQAYRKILGEHIDAESPFSKAALTWRLFKLLPCQANKPDFAPLQQFLADDHDLRKRYALAQCLADLFDQYQVYRADWLNDWAQGQNHVNDSHGRAQLLSAAHIWQAELWRALLTDIPDRQRRHSRAFLHEQFL